MKIDSVLFQNNFNIKTAFKVVLLLSPLCSTIYILLSLITSVLPVTKIYVLSTFIDNTISNVSGNSITRATIVSFIFLCILLILEKSIPLLTKLLLAKITIKANTIIAPCLVRKISSIPYYLIEDSETCDVLVRIRERLLITTISTYQHIISLFIIIIQYITTLIVLFNVSVNISLVFVFFSIPIFLVAQWSGKATYKANQDITKSKRVYEYISEILTKRQYVDERNLFSYSEFYNAEFTKQYIKALNTELKVEKKWYMRMKSSGLLASFASLVIIFTLINSTIKGEISIGLFASILTSLKGLISMVTWNLASEVDSISEQSAFLKEYSAFSSTNFSDIESTLNDTSLIKIEEFESLEFINVFFKYPNSTEYILRGLSFKIEKGKHYSFVGPNGAGKTTITKLILGLYTEYEGKIELNGLDIKTIDNKYISENINSLFQDYAYYQLPIIDSISLGNVFESKNISEINKACNNANLTDMINDLPNGIHTHLGKISENGIDLSGGEFQRVALARCFYSKAELKILDEPTASLDPMQEIELYNHYSKILSGKTTILISHRLASSQLSDTIFVLDNGEIVETGNFNQLVNCNGVFADMYGRQRKWYIEKRDY